MPHQGQSKYESLQVVKGTPSYSGFEGDMTDKSRGLLQWHTENGHENILFMDEKIFTIEEQYSCQNNKIYVKTSHEVQEKVPRMQRVHHPSYVMVWWAVSH
jgi:hypothetical protein